MIKDCLEREDTDSLVGILKDHHPADVAHALRHLDEDERELVFGLLDEKDEGIVLEELDRASRIEILEDIDSKELVEIMQNLPPEETVDIIADLPEERLEEVVDLLEETLADEVRGLLQYPEGTAGSLMTPHLISVQRDMTVPEVVDCLRDWANLMRNFTCTWWTTRIVL